MTCVLKIVVLGLLITLSNAIEQIDVEQDDFYLNDMEGSSGWKPYGNVFAELAKADNTTTTKVTEKNSTTTTLKTSPTTTSVKTTSTSKNTTTTAKTTTHTTTKNTTTHTTKITTKNTTTT
jgi:hypothetical protein